MSGGLKAAKQALARPLDGMVRAERNSKSWRNARGRAAAARGGHGLFAHAHLDAQPEATRGSSLGLSAPRRGSSRSVRELARSALRTAHRAREPQDRAMRPSLARGPQARSSLQDGSTALPKKRALTFDMSGGPKGAKRPLERPLDGGVRGHSSPCCVTTATMLRRTPARQAKRRIDYARKLRATLPAATKTERRNLARWRCL